MATLSLAAILAESARRHPDKAGLVEGELRITFKELWLQARKQAAALIAAACAAGGQGGADGAQRGRVPARVLRGARRGRRRRPRTPAPVRRGGRARPARQRRHAAPVSSRSGEDRRSGGRGDRRAHADPRRGRRPGAAHARLRAPAHVPHPRRGRPRRRVLHERHHRRPQGRRPQPFQPGDERDGQRLRRPRRALRRHRARRAAALPRLRADRLHERDVARRLPPSSSSRASTRPRPST